MLLRFRRFHHRVSRRFEQKVMNILVHELTLMNESIAEPNIDRVQTAHHAQTIQTHLFMNLTQCSVTIRLTLTNVPLGKSPFTVRVLYHGKVYQAVDTLKHKAASGDLGAMSLSFAFIAPGGNRSPRRIGGRDLHVRLQR